ncbi:MAG TPA: FAD-dependent oxidoreductase [Actinoallomurus sp.]
MQETPDLYGAYPRLDADEIALVAEYGTRRPARRDEVLLREGDHDYDFYVISQGTVAVLENGEVIRVHGAGRFLGELGQLTGQPAFFTAIMQEDGEVVAVPYARLRELIARQPWFGDLVLRAYMIRRSLLIELGAGLRIIGSRFSPDTRRLRDFAARNRLPHRWIDLEEDEEAESLLRELGIPADATPVVIVFGDQILRNPSNPELARVTGLPMPEPAAEENVHDLIVIGAGPAGLAAAVYGASEGLDTLVLDAIATGGQAGTSSRIENYLGFPTGISGGELAERAVIQCRKFGARLSIPTEATGLECTDGSYGIRHVDGGFVRSRSVVIATGARYRRLNVPRLEDFEGRGVYYAATEVEALSCRQQPVIIVGGGNSAGQAALFLARHASLVRIFSRGKDLAQDMSRYLIDRIEQDEAVEVHAHTEVRELLGDRVLEAVVAEDNRTGERRTFEASNLFVFIGADPCVGWLAGSVELDEKGYVRTGHGDALPLETNLAGVFAVGDVRSGSIKRVASAVGEGSMAVRLVHQHLSG